jgi:hypothetical protein
MNSEYYYYYYYLSYYSTFILNWIVFKLLEIKTLNAFKMFNNNISLIFDENNFFFLALDKYFNITL